MKTVCIVGCGRFARVHARHLKPFVGLTFCSRTRSSAERCCRRFGGAGVFERFDQAIASPDITAVVIVSPPEFHAAQVALALDAGKGVLVEKPMCVTREEVDAIGRAIGRNPGSLLMVAENYYYKPILATIRRAIDDGALGRIESVLVQKLRVQASAGWKCQHGALLEGGVHFVAFISDIFSSAPETVSAVFPGRVAGAPERRSITSLRYPGGARAELRYSWESPSPTAGVFQHSWIAGTDGTLMFESNGLYAALRSGRHGRRMHVYLRDVMGRRRMTRDFIECLADRSKAPYSDFARASRDLGVVFGAYRGLQVPTTCPRRPASPCGT